MRVDSLQFHLHTGWTKPFPELDSPQTLVLVFGASAFADRPEPLDQLMRYYPQSHVIGCSTSGEIFGEDVFDDSMSVAVVQFSHTRVRSASARITEAAGSHVAGRQIGSALAAADLKGVLVLSDGLALNGTLFSAGLSSVLGPHVPVTGGLAGDGARFERTWVVLNGVATEGAVVAVGLYGTRVNIGYGSGGGWDGFGLERVVTRSEGNVLYEVDGRPALDLYEAYLGELARGLPATALHFPLSLRKNSESNERVVRTVLSVNLEERSLTFAGDLPQGHLAQLMRSNLDRLVDGAEQAVQNLISRVHPSGPGLLVAISCVGRRLVMRDRVEEEVEATLERIPAGTLQVGFYSYGELSPSRTGRCDLHNQTMTLTGIWES